MSSINTNATVTLTVNGKQAEDMLQKLKSQANDLEQAIAKAAATGDKTKLTKLQHALKATNRQIQQIESATVGVEEVMKRLDHSTPKELQQTLRTLNKQLNGIERGSDAWEEQTAKIRQVKEELSKVNSELRQGEGFWDKLNNKLNDWQTAIATVAASVTGLIMAGRSAVNAYADMDSEMANVRKFTGLADESVVSLNEDFKKIDTRTSREDLNKLAEEAGRLGKQSQDDVLGFVKAADQIDVALDDLGDDATLTLSKLTNIFGDEKKYGTEKSLLKVGSVINELSQNCTASAPYLAEFAQRMAGVGAQAQMTIPQIMGLAAVLDSQGQAVEMSATSVSKLIMDMFKQKDKVIKATGMDANKFNEELKKSTNDGLMYMLETLSKLGKIDALAPVFKDMGENGARAAQVIAALAGNLDMVKWEQGEANKAFKEGTSVTNEFSVQNSTVQAGLDKAKKSVSELAIELGGKLMPVMSHVISSTTLMLKFLSIMVTFFIEHQKAIISTTAAFVAYNIAVNASNIAFKIHYAWIVISTTATKIYTGAVALLKGAYLALDFAMAKVTRNYTHQSWLMSDMKKNATMLKNVYALLAAAIVGVAVAITLYIKDLLSISKAQKALNDIEKEGMQKSVEQKQKIESLVDAMNNENLSMKERQKAVNMLNKMIPGYNAHLDKTRKRYVANKQKLDEYIDSLVHMYEVMGAKEQIKKIGEKRAELQIEKTRAENELKQQQKIYKAETQANSRIGGREAHAMQMGDNMLLHKATKKVADLNKAIHEQDEVLATIKKTYGTDIQKSAINSNSKIENDDLNTYQATPVSPSGAGGDGNVNDSKSEERFAKEKAWKEKQEAINRIAYAKGEKDYEEYTQKQDDITIEYNHKILSRQDLTDEERLSTEAEYYEAQKKQSDESQKYTLESEESAYKESIAIENQRFIDGKIDKETYDETLEQMELDHLKKMVSLNKKGTKEYQEAKAEYQSKLIDDQKKRQADTEKLEKEHQENLKSIKNDYFGDNISERQKKYNSDLAALKEIYNQEITAAGNNATEKLRIEKAYLDAQKLLRKKYRLDEVIESKTALQKWNDDVLEWLDSDAGKALQGSFETVVSGMSSIFTQLTSLVQAETEIQQSVIQKRYDMEISQAEGNNYKVKKLEKQREKDIAKVKSEANKKQFAMQVIQAVAQTAQNALAAYGSAAAIPVVGYILAPVAAAMAVAAGALQVATIKKQQQASEAQGYSEGGFTPKGPKHKEVGIVHAGEWVASQKLLADPVARPMIEALDFAQRTNTIGSLKAEDVTAAIHPVLAQSKTEEPLGIQVQEFNPDNDKQEAIPKLSIKDLNNTIKRLQERLDEPFVTVNTVTGDTGIKKAQDEYEKLIRNKTPKSRRK
ncbi:phage tail tape measure protein [Segatella bryantii]|uniref:phage tail tape measure protein n=1 Tax=Segatella bryantii TaxID=77095 RepID=UPI0008802EBE|nr:phage tail tape measure protein [Segatella bryantii]SDL49642.1 phage tail tape measure protein, TP901 family, core region [Segatella bryantii]